MFRVKHNLLDNEPGQAGGSGEDLAAQLTELQSQLASQNAELDRLRKHSDKVLDEKKKLQQAYKAFEGLQDLGDPETISNMVKQFQQNEDLRMFAEGKGADVLKKHTERLELDFNNKIEELVKERDTLHNESNKYAKLYHESEAGHALRAAAVAAGVRDSALDDILLRGKGVFIVSDDGTLEARDSEGKLRTVKGKALTPDLFIESLRDKYPHYWPESVSSDARGGGGGSNTPNPFKKGSKEYNLTEQAKIRRTNPELAKQLEAEAAG